MKIGIITALADFTASESAGERKETGLPPYLQFSLGSSTVKIPPPVPNLGPVLLATVLKRNGYSDVVILDFYADPAGSSAALETRDFNVLLFHTSFMVIKTMVDLSVLARTHNGDAILIAGGQVAFDVPEYLLDNRYFDYVVIGEGEAVVVELMLAIESGSAVSLIPGVYSREGYAYRPQIENIDEIPYPDWSCIDLKKYIRSLPVETIRGCPYTCSYCSESQFWRKPVRYKSVSRVVDELEHAKNNYAASMFRIIDSTFSHPPERAIRICQEIVRRALRITWTCFVRADDVTDDLAAAMAAAGCIAVFIGAESGSNEILRSMNKRSSNAIIKSSIVTLKKHGIFVHTNFIIGFPGETDGTIMETVHLIRDALPNTFSMSPLYISRGTKIYDDRDQYGIRGALDQWEGDTRGHDDFIRIIHEIYQRHLSRLDGSYYCFGGECVVNFLICMGFTMDEVMSVFRTINDLCSRSTAWVLFQFLLSKIHRGPLVGFFSLIQRYQQLIG